MAIKIPSRNIYEKDNDKIRDNKIDRIEVGAFEVVPNNEYETPVYNEDISFDLNSLEIVENSDKEKYQRNTDDMFDTLEYDGGYVYFDNKVKYLSSVLTIPKLKNNNFISKLYYGKDNENKNEVKYSLILNKTKKPVSASVELGFTTAKLISKSYGELVDEGNKTQEDIKLPITIKNTEGGVIVSVDGVQDETNMTVNFVEDENEYRLSYKVLVYMYSEWYTGGYKDVIGTPGYSTQTIEAKGYVEEYTPLKLEITVYGNTIGIDLQDKTIYVPSNSGNKPFSVEGNELMQSSYLGEKPFPSDKLAVNYTGGTDSTVYLIDEIPTDKKITGYITYTYNGNYREKFFIINKGDYTSNNITLLSADNGYTISATIEDYELAIAFSKTQAHYAKGKETATIRCSISDYYDEKGEKVIATNNSNKMAFDIYDEVIPYSYGADGSDKPLSRHKDGSPKTFVVLGTRIFYDGAVWQELTLQEK